MRTFQAESKAALYPPSILGKNVPSVRAKARLLLPFQGQRFVVNTCLLRFLSQSTKRNVKQGTQVNLFSSSGSACSNREWNSHSLVLIFGTALQ